MTDWYDEAACRGMPPALFFPESGENAGDAKAVCFRCPVRLECLDEGIKHRYGVYGGLTEKERRPLRRRRRAA